MYSGRVISNLDYKDAKNDDATQVENVRCLE